MFFYGVLLCILMIGNLHAKRITFINPEHSSPTKILENWIQPGERKTIEVTQPALADGIEYSFGTPVESQRRSTSRCRPSFPPGPISRTATFADRRFSVWCKISPDELQSNHEIVLY